MVVLFMCLNRNYYTITIKIVFFTIFLLFFCSTLVWQECNLLFLLFWLLIHHHNYYYRLSTTEWYNHHHHHQIITNWINMGSLLSLLNLHRNATLKRDIFVDFESKYIFNHHTWTGVCEFVLNIEMNYNSKLVSVRYDKMIMKNLINYVKWMNFWIWLFVYNRCPTNRIGTNDLYCSWQYIEWCGQDTCRSTNV